MLPQPSFIRGLSFSAVVLALALAFGLFVSGCGPVYGYPDYPSYGYAPYSYGWGNSWGYEPTFVVHHPWEDHYDVGHHETFYHTPVAPVGHEVGSYGGGAVHGEAVHGGGGGGHAGGGGHGDGHH
jgi:hypothetical protein